MGNQFTTSTQDTQKLDPKVLASELRDAFDAYYTHRKSVLERRAKDIAALRVRANITPTNIPAVVGNVIAKLYTN